MTAEDRDVVKRHVKVWVALMLLLALTCGSAYLRLGVGKSIINLALAVAKAALVVTFFMHLLSSRVVIRVAAGTALFTIALLFIVSSCDYFTREVYRAPVFMRTDGGNR